MAAGHNVTIFTRGNQKVEFAHTTERIIGDRTDYSKFKELMAKRSFDAVVDNIAYEANDVDCALEVFNGQIGQYILCSSGSVYRFTDNFNLPIFNAISEPETDLEPVGDHPYNDGKRACEKVLINAKANKITIPYTIIRPTVVHGSHDPTYRSWFWVSRILDKEPILLPYTLPSSMFNHVYANDVAQAMFQAIGNKRAFNNIYNIAGTDIITLEEFLFLISKALNLTLNLYLASAKVIAEQSELAQYEPVFLGYRHVLDIHKAISDLNFQPSPISQWLKTTVDTIAKQPPDKAAASYGTRCAEIDAAKKFGLKITG